MTRKANIQRHYKPEYVSAETLAYLLDMSRSTLDDYVRVGHLPKPEGVGPLQRWDLAEVRAWIKTQNGKLDASAAFALPSPDDGEDPFKLGLRNAKATHA